MTFPKSYVTKEGYKGCDVDPTSKLKRYKCRVEHYSCPGMCTEGTVKGEYVKLEDVKELLRQIYSDYMKRTDKIKKDLDDLYWWREL